MKRIFESSLEKIGRIIAGQYGINVVFEGSQAQTDGETIYLPSTADLTPELMQDMQGFLDHEVSHCRYTEFKQIGLTIKGKGAQFHKQLLNATEDGRIERLMIEDFPGCRFNLGPLNQKLRAKLKDKWPTLPWPVRLICTVRDLMDGEPDAAVDDAEIKPFLDLLSGDIADLNAATSTEGVRLVTETMTRKILEKLDEQDEKSEEGKGGEKKEGKGKGKPGEGGKGSGKGEPSEGDADEGEPVYGDEGGPGDEMAREAGVKDGEEDKRGKSKWNEVDLSVDDMIRRDLKAHFGEETPTKRPVPRAGETRPEDRGIGGVADPDRTRSHKPHVPFSTRFDQLRDFSGQGNVDRYRRLRQQVQVYVGPIKRMLEKKLKVDAHMKHRGERERGLINTRALAQVVADKNFRRPFKELTKKETNNVAVQILIDQSGSMGGQKIETAKMSAIAMAEALTELGINFEITGFYSVGDAGAMTASRGCDPARFNRRGERLEKHVFKAFGTNSLTGIERVSVGGNNPDGEAVRWAADRLMMQKQKRKIMIVMSDGQPSTGEGDHRVLRGDLFDSVRRIMRAGVEVIGFGIQDRAVAEFYPDHVLIDRLTELPVKTMGKLAGLLSNG